MQKEVKYTASVQTSRFEAKFEGTNTPSNTYLLNENGEPTNISPEEVEEILNFWKECSRIVNTLEASKTPRVRKNKQVSTNTGTAPSVN